MKTTKPWLVPFLCVALLLPAAALADSANLESALGHLQSARNALERGERKGSHRKEALQSVDQAITAVRKGIEQERRKERKAEKREVRKEEKAARKEQKQEKKAAKKAARDEKKAEE
ncbi:MAG: hypothetical protein ABFS41_01105 [Myxococcota bacterium]